MSTRKKVRAAQKRNGWVWLLALLLIAAIVTGVLLFERDTAPATGALPREVSVDQAVEMQSTGAFVLDVRTQAEWEEFHAPNSTHIPLDQLASRVDELPRDQEIVVVCRSGNRSVTARDLLLDAGFSEVTSMAGGLNQWRSLGYPTLTGP